MKIKKIFGIISVFLVLISCSKEPSFNSGKKYSDSSSRNTALDNTFKPIVDNNPVEQDYFVGTYNLYPDSFEGKSYEYYEIVKNNNGEYQLNHYTKTHQKVFDQNNIFTPIEKNDLNGILSNEIINKIDIPIICHDDYNNRDIIIARVNSLGDNDHKGWNEDIDSDIIIIYSNVRRIIKLYKGFPL